MADTDQARDLIEERGEYKHGFVSEVDSEVAPPGLGEDTVRLIWEKKGEPDFMLDWRLKAYRRWLDMEGEGEPGLAKVSYEPIDY